MTIMTLYMIMTVSCLTFHKTRVHNTTVWWPLSSTGRGPNDPHRALLCKTMTTWMAWILNIHVPFIHKVTGGSFRTSPIKGLAARLQGLGAMYTWINDAPPIQATCGWRNCITTSQVAKVLFTYSCSLNTCVVNSTYTILHTFLRHVEYELY